MMLGTTNIKFYNNTMSDTSVTGFLKKEGVSAFLNVYKRI